jgi:sugar phosphate isomerase/epimerase
MTHPRLSVDAMCTYSWTFDQDLQLWSSTGVRHAGLLASKLTNPEGDMARLAGPGITASSLIVEGFNLADPETWEKTRSAQREALELMARHGGRSIYFTPGRTTGNRWSEDADRLAEAIAPTVDYGRQLGVKVAIEPSLRTRVSFINTLRDAIDFAERTGIGIVADFGNMWMERDFRETLARAMPYITLIQICDMVIGESGCPAPGERVHIGAGELPLRRMMRDVLDAGYTGVFDLEVVPVDFTKAADAADVRRGIKAASELLDEFGV